MRKVSNFFKNIGLIKRIREKRRLIALKNSKSRKKDIKKIGKLRSKKIKNHSEEFTNHLSRNFILHRLRNNRKKARFRDK
jgi:hypothetical protein